MRESMAGLPMTKALAMRVEFADVHYFIARTKALQSYRENMYGVEIRQYGSAVALMVKETQNLIFNRVMGAGDDTVEVLDEIIEWYRSNGRSCRFDVVPGIATPSLLSALTKRGFHHSSFYGAFYTEAAFEQNYTPPVDVAIERIPSGDRNLMSDIYATGFNLPARSQPVMKDSLKALFGSSAARFYGASINGKLVAVGLLFMSDSVGYLASTTTLPQYRNRGCQMALIHQRISDAALEQCSMIVSQASFASVSQRNLEKAGLRMAYTKAIWTPHFSEKKRP
jgi:hypothetical protein